MIAALEMRRGVKTRNGRVCSRWIGIKWKVGSKGSRQVGGNAGTDGWCGLVWPGFVRFLLSQSIANLQRAQEVDQILLVRRSHLIEVDDCLIRFRLHVGAVGHAVVVFDRGHHVVGAAIVQEPEALPDAPQRRGAELISSRIPLHQAISQTRSHVMQYQIRVKSERFGRQRGPRGSGRGERRSVAVDATGEGELSLAVLGGGGGSGGNRG